MRYSTPTEPRWTRRCFSLIELIASIAVLLVIILIVTKAVSHTQQVWLNSSRNQEVFENAHIALDFITRDLEGIMATNFANEEIYVYTGGPSLACAFVSTTVNDGASAADVYEIAYSLDSADSVLYRWKTGSADGDNWDFLGNDPSVWALTWGGFEALSEGITNISFEFYKNSNTPPYRVPYVDLTDSHTVPDVVRVAVTVVPKDTLVLPEAVQLKHRREFTKLIFINH